MSNLFWDKLIQSQTLCILSLTNCHVMLGLYDNPDHFSVICLLNGCMFRFSYIMSGVVFIFFSTLCQCYFICGFALMIFHVTLGLCDTLSQSHFALFLIISHVILGCLEIWLQLHGLSGFDHIISHVMFGFLVMKTSQ